ncbi:YrzI family small protein [Cytobacillus sp. FJAT-54145]|uniref:YrzI family small protein n=1 Tax=Cytobacillus spartinae TaxID=3299023 RepID=A0ABW6KHM8_9BACI
MTLNILFLTVNINKRKITGEEALRKEMAKKAFNDTKAINIHRL